MSDLSKLSDADLLRLYQQQGSGAASAAAQSNPLAGMSDEELLKLLAAQPAAPASTAVDVAKSVGSGLVKGVAGLVTLPQTMKDLGNQGVDYVLDAASRGLGFGGLPQKPETALDRLPSLPRQGDVVRGVETVMGPLHKPETQAGRYAETVAEFVPGAVAGPGGVVRNTVRYAALPGVASEAAGQATKGTQFEPWARGGAALVGAGAGHLAMRPGTPGRVVGEAMGNVDQQAIDAAGRLMQDAGARGITLTWPEAIQQVTNSGTKLADVQRVVEASQRGGAVMRPVMAERPGQVENAVRQNLDRVAAPGADPYSVGPQASRAAQGTIDDVNAAINRQTRPLYQMAELDRVPAAQYQQLANDARYQAALADLRAHPEIGPEIAHLPDNAIPVVDQAKKLLQARSEVTPVADATERYLASLRGTAGTNAVNAATRNSAPYAQAVAEQAQLRGQYLEPLQNGPVGQIAGATGTEAVVNAALPVAPLSGSTPNTAQAFRAIAAREPEAAANIVRQRMEGTYNQAGRDLQGGPNEWGGANYAAKIYGNPQARDNLRTAITETSGQPVVRDTDALMEALQATGRRQHPGSQTEFNRLLAQTLQGGGTIGEAISGAAGKFNPLSAVRDRYQQWRFGANTDDLARMLLEAPPAEMARIAQSARGNPQVGILLADVLADIERRGKAVERRNQNP